MDRFIGYNWTQWQAEQLILKSNMDRFIALPPHIIKEVKEILKSNMDRFIEVQKTLAITLLKF